MKVLILHTAPPETVDSGRRAPSEFDLGAAARGIAKVLPGSLGGAACGESRARSWAALTTHAPEVVYNLCEAPLGRSGARAACGRAPRVGGRPFHRIGQRDAFAVVPPEGSRRRRAGGAGVPVPQAGGLPCIVKPADQDGSVVPRSASPICDDYAAVARACARAAGPARDRGVSARPRVRRVAMGQRRARLRVDRRNEVRGMDFGSITYAAKWKSRARTSPTHRSRTRSIWKPAATGRDRRPRRKAHGEPLARGATRGSTCASMPPVSQRSSTSIPIRRRSPEVGNPTGRR